LQYIIFAKARNFKAAQNVTIFTLDFVMERLDFSVV